MISKHIQIKVLHKKARPNICRVSSNYRIASLGQVERIILNRKILHCFVSFSIINKNLINKGFANPCTPVRFRENPGNICSKDVFKVFTIPFR